MKMIAFLMVAFGGVASTAFAGLSGKCTVAGFDASVMGDEGEIDPILTETILVENVDDGEWEFPIPDTDQEIQFSISETNMINGYRSINLSILTQGNGSPASRTQAASVVSANDLTGFSLATVSDHYGAYIRCE